MNLERWKDGDLGEKWLKALHESFGGSVFPRGESTVGNFAPHYAHQMRIECHVMYGCYRKRGYLLGTKKVMQVSERVALING